MPLAFAEAASGYADTAWRHSAHLDSRSGLLLEEALDGLPEGTDALRIRLMGSLANDRLHSGRPEESKALNDRKDSIIIISASGM